MGQLIRIGTRKSMLALAQAQIIAEDIKKNNADAETKLIPMSTIGDKILDKPLESFGGKGAFISEFEEAILSGEIDIAVHSAKDMPILLPKDLDILAVSKREDPRDVIISKKDGRMALEEDSIIGTGSLRRGLQSREQNKVQIKGLRGNVNTRLNKLRAGEYDAIILAAAGLKRLQLDKEEDLLYEYLDTDTFIPAAGQGIIAIEGKKDGKVADIVRQLNDKEAYYCLEIEREVLRLLNAGCNEPIGVFASIKGDNMSLRILYAYGEKVVRVRGENKIENRLLLAKELVDNIKMKIGQE